VVRPGTPFSRTREIFDLLKTTRKSAITRKENKRHTLAMALGRALSVFAAENSGRSVVLFVDVATASQWSNSGALESF